MAVVCKRRHHPSIAKFTVPENPALLFSFRKATGTINNNIKIPNVAIRGNSGTVGEGFGLSLGFCKEADVGVVVGGVVVFSPKLKLSSFLLFFNS
jgi:hypothetical protein